jgi:diaminopimelate epimerase
MQFWHMSGAGNDFMVMDARGLSLDFSQLAKKLCAMTGADGFMAVDYAEDADFLLHFYNADGSRGEMCGNGSRCISLFAYENGIAGEEMTIHTDAGLVYARRLSENQYRVKLNDPGVLDLNRKKDAAYVELGMPGVPHGIVEVPGLEFSQMQDLLERAISLRYDKAFPKGANINFYTWLGDGAVRVLTYERGVEDYTLACGTGCSSVAVTLAAKGLLPDGKLTCENRGGTLKIRVSQTDDRIYDIYLEGPAQRLRTYDLDL